MELDKLTLSWYVVADKSNLPVEALMLEQREFLTRKVKIIPPGRSKSSGD